MAIHHMRSTTIGIANDQPLTAAKLHTTQVTNKQASDKTRHTTGWTISAEVKPGVNTIFHASGGDSISAVKYSRQVQYVQIVGKVIFYGV
jgi:hypothetical protein